MNKIKTKTLHWDYTGPWNYYRRTWRSNLFTWIVLAWEIGMLSWTHAWPFLVGSLITVLAACIPFLTWHRSIKPHLALRAAWADAERAAIGRLDIELARPDLPPEVRAVLQVHRQICQESLARWTAPTSTVPRRSTDVKRELDGLIEKMELGRP